MYRGQREEFNVQHLIKQIMKTKQKCEQKLGRFRKKKSLKRQREAKKTHS
jgi:hypothetical protein